MAEEATIKLKPKVTEAWQKDRVTFKFFNQETHEDHTFTVNGVVFSLTHNSVNTAPRAVVNALNDAKNIRWKLNDENMNKTPEKYEEPRMLAILIGDNPVVDTKDIKSDAKTDVLKDIISDQQGERGKLKEKE